MNDNLINRYRDTVLNIKKKYNYDNNITHLLYIIIPAFVYKYKYMEKMIINIFNEIEIITKDNKSEYIKAFYTSIPSYIDNKIVTKKYVIINDYNNIGLIQLLDNLIHEFNHAVNSYNNEFTIDKDKLFLRTGLSFVTYSIPNFNAIGKDNSFVLEEVINTRQTEEIIDIIKKLESDDTIINNIIYSLNNETFDNYKSNAYALEANILNNLINNKTFLSTIENLRINGEVYYIYEWFDNIVGIDNSYLNLINKLNDIFNLEIEYSKRFFLKKRIIFKIKNIIKDVDNIINLFNSNCNYK